MIFHKLNGVKLNQAFKRNQQIRSKSSKKFDNDSRFHILLLYWSVTWHYVLCHWHEYFINPMSKSLRATKDNVFFYIYHQRICSGHILAYIICILWRFHLFSIYFFSQKHVQLTYADGKSFHIKLKITKIVLLKQVFNHTSVRNDPT